ncbi:hypothetical protein FBUS_09396 [Fasciolopsis buskii]|uniref:Uncharacterized protein n=1 Tax=Fasciolopsis buskii TaxID=27845 RepID=A0A8E0S0R2_9TREM|nr:hypothetical protein FBUS_09396 [Fasciolopsis buski]
MHSIIGTRTKNNPPKNRLSLTPEVSCVCSNCFERPTKSRPHASTSEFSSLSRNKNNTNPIFTSRFSPSIRFARSNKWNSGDAENVPSLTKACLHRVDKSTQLSLCTHRDSATTSGRVHRSGRSKSAPGNENDPPRIRCFSKTPGDSGRIATLAFRCSSTPAITKADYVQSARNFSSAKPRPCGLIRDSSEPARQSQLCKVRPSEMADYRTHRPLSHPARPLSRLMFAPGSNWWSKRKKDSKPPWFPAGRGGTAVSHHRQFQTVSKSVRVNNFLYKISAKGYWDGQKWPSSSPGRSFIKIGLENLSLEACRRTRRLQWNLQAPNYAIHHQLKQNTSRKQPCLVHTCSTISNENFTQNHMNPSRKPTPVDHSKRSTTLTRLSTGLVRPNINRWEANDNAEIPLGFRHPLIQPLHVSPNSKPVQNLEKPSVNSTPFYRNNEFDHDRVGDSEMRSNVIVKASSADVTTKNKSPILVASKSSVKIPLHHTQEQEGAQWDPCTPHMESDAPLSPDQHSLNFHTTSARSLTSIDLDVIASSCILNVSGDACTNNDEDTLEVPRNTVFIPGPEPFVCQNSSPASTSHAFSGGPVTYASLWDRTYDCPTPSDGISSECLMASSSTHPSRTSPFCANRAEEAWCDTLVNLGSTRLKAVSQETLVHVTDVSELTDNQYSSMVSKAHSSIEDECGNENGNYQVTQDLELCDATTLSSLNEKEPIPHVDNHPQVIEDDLTLIQDNSSHETRENPKLACPAQSIPAVELSQPGQVTSSTKSIQAMATPLSQKACQCERVTRSGDYVARVKGIGQAEDQIAFTRTRSRRRFLRRLRRTARIISSGRKRSLVVT